LPHGGTREECKSSKLEGVQSSWRVVGLEEVTDTGGNEIMEGFEDRL